MREKKSRRKSNNLITVKYIDVSSLRIRANWVIKLIELVLKKEKKKDLEMNVVITNDNFIRKINKEYRGKDRATDVISFSYDDFSPDRKLILFGDIIISLDTAKRQAKENGHSLEKEFATLLIHGLYHLMGYDHCRLMREKESRALEMINNLIIKKGR
jgi:probable rRNA maturation factor